MLSLKLNMVIKQNAFLFTIPLIYLEYYARISNFMDGTNHAYISFLKIQKLVLKY